jgi:ISXO2-like transposase domain
MHASRKARAKAAGSNRGKAVVIGMLERKGRIRAAVIPDRSIPVMRDHVRGNVDPGSVIFSDEHAGHWKMEDQYKHQIVNHAEQYVEGNIHTNGMENFWSLLKRGLHGTYISVEPFHLFRYIDEQAFRFNNRKDMNDGDRFIEVMKHAVGRRLTYAELTGKVEERPNEEEVEPF